MSLKVDCRKFSPNIFNKQKCATCFKHKEEHTAEALDSNRASRKVQRCGFLFVAPDWDFAIPLNRTKRWQRRWFVLYDDGELTYSVDDHPETVPQGIIDMASVLEVANSEEVTGNSYSIALTASDRVTFIKGTCREEARWWMQALSMYVSLVKGRHKRNATFPGGRSTTTPALNAIDSTDCGSCHTPPQSRRRLLPSLSAPPHRVQAEREHQPPVLPSASPPPPLPLSPPPADSPPPPPVPEPLQRIPIRAETVQRRDASSRTKPSESPPTQDRFRQHRNVTRCSTRANNKAAISSVSSACLEAGSTRRDTVDGGALTVRRTRPTSIGQNESDGCAYLSEYSLKREEKLKNIADSLTRPRPTRSYSYLSSIGHTMQSSRDTPTRDNAEDVISPSGPASISRIPDVVHTHSQLRDDPDGCAVVMETDGCYSNSLDQLRVDLPAEDLLHIKKGWLMKRNTQQVLVKHWFVLRGSSLIYYRDTAAEDNSLVEGFVDLTRVQRVDECEAEKNYGFQLTTWEGATMLLSAMTAGIRANWIQAIRNAAKLLVSTATTSGALSNGEAANVSAASQRLQGVTDERTRDSKYNAAVLPERDLPLTTTVLPSVGSFVNQQHSSEEDEDDEYRTASETSAAGLDDDVDDDVKEAGAGDVIPRQSSARPRRQNRRSSLASSRSSIERSRSRSTSLSRSSSGSKRSRSSPPLSRRNNGSANRKPPLLDSSAGSANHRSALLDAHAGSANHIPALLNAHAGSANHRSALLDTPAADRVDSPASPHTTWALRKETLRSSLRSSLRTGTMLADQRDGFSRADRPHMRSSLRAVTVPTGVTPGGESANYSVGCHPEMSLVQRRRLTAATDSQQVEEWRSRANSLEDQVAQLLDQLQLLRDQLEEKNDQLKGAAELQERYSRLLDRHEQLQNSRDAAGESEQWRLHYEKLEERYLKDHTCWESKLQSSEDRVREMRQQQESHAETDKTVRQLNNGLKRAEGQLKTMRDQLEAAHVARTRDVQKLHDAASLKDIENSRLRDELQTLQVIRDSAKQDKSEVYKLKDLVQDLRSLLEDKTSELERQRREARDARQDLAALRVEFESCQSRLQQGIDENETLTSQISELRRSTTRNIHPSTGSTSTMSTAYSTADSLASNPAGSASRESSCSTRQLSRFESLSDLTCGVTCDVSDMGHQSLLEEYATLRSRFDTAIGEIRALKRQLRQAHVLQDQLELSSAQTVAQLQVKESCQISESQLMTERLQDLTSKLANAEKQLRQLKPKLTRADVKDRRRTSSLKGRDSFPSIPRELETKLQDLEQRVTSMEVAEKQQLPAVMTAAAVEAAAPPTPVAAATVRTPRRFEESTKSSRLRRKSLDSATAAGDSLRFIMRVNALEQKVSTPSVGGQTAVRKSQRARSAELRRPSVVAGEPRPASPDHRAAAAVTREEEEAARARLSRLESTVVDIKDGIDACVIELQDVQVSQVTTVCSRLQSLSVQLVTTADSSLPLSSSSGCSASTAAAAAHQLASRTSCLLQSSYKQLAVEELELRAAGRWSSTERRKHDIRRFACQTVLAACLAQVHQTVRDGDDPAAAERRLKLQQLLEVHRRVSALQRRLESPEEVDGSSSVNSSANCSSSMIGTFVSVVADKLGAADDLSAALRPRSLIRAASTKRVSSALQQDQQLRHLHDTLLKRQAEVTSAFEAFRTETLQRLAAVLVEETESSRKSSKDRTSPGEDVVSRMRSQAHDNITQAMAATEMTSTMGGVVSSHDRVAELDRHSAVLLSDITGRRYELSVQCLQSEMERTNRTLNGLYEEAMSQTGSHLSKSSTQPENRPLGNSSRRLLSQLASMVAQKSLVDGYVQALAECGDDSAGCCSSEVPLGIIEEDATTNGVQGGSSGLTPTLRSLEDAFDGDSALALFFHGSNSSTSELLDRAQFQMLYRSAVERCRVDLMEFAIAIPAAESIEEFCDRTQLTIASVREESRTKVKQITEQHQLQVKSLEKELEGLRRMRVRARSADKSRRRVSDITGMVKPSDIIPVAPLVDDVRRQQLSLSRSHSTVAPSHSTVAPSHPTVASPQSTSLSDVCQRCLQLHATIESSNSEHVQELETLRKKQDSDLEDLRREMTQEVEKVTATYETEKQLLGGEVEQLRRRLQLLETEYATQIQLLNDQYQARERAGKEAEDAMVEENIRRRYQAEIEQLRGLCEKGLVAMENSHRRIIAELGEKHRRELHCLEADKQKALAEETQATLAALDALRKAHQNEVQKEVAKFKEEFISRMQPGLDIGKMHQEHTAEMEDIKSEILGLSEKYSIKCLESASLEEKVDSLSRNLQQANLQTFQLDARNKQFRAQLGANITELSRCPREQRTSSQQMALLENQLTCAQENAQRLQQELLATQKREVETTGLCRQLSTYLRAERQLRADEVSSLRERLEHIILTSSRCTTGSGGGRAPTDGSGGSSDTEERSPRLRRGASLTSARIKELMRSPSCPRLSGYLAVSGETSAPRLGSPLYGMVASRKMAFEKRLRHK